MVSGRQWKRKGTPENLYSQGHLERVITCFKSLCSHDDKNGIPSSIYLSTRDTWLWNMLWVIYTFHLKEDDTATKKYFPLFCMLPHVLVGASSGVAVKEFCKYFYDGVKNRQDDISLLSIMAIGCANAALYYKCCMYPYPTNMSSENLKCSGYTTEGIFYKQLWQECFIKHWGTSTNPILYYYQRFYMNYLLEGSGFNPGMRAHWMSSSNRPWDMDHIIPDSWWQNKEYQRNHISNIQVLDFRRNRSKNNHSVAVSLFEEESRFDEQWYECLRDDKDNMNRNKLSKESSSPDKEERLLNRFNHIIKSTVEDLYLVDLISEMNNLGISDAEQQKMLPTSLRNAIHRHRLMKAVSEKLRNDGYEVCWGTVKFKWRQKGQDLDAILTVSLDEPDFYHSLTPELSVGIPKKKDLLLVALNCSAEDNRLEIGLRRGLDISLETWCSKHGNNQNHWWREWEEFSLFDEKNKVVDIVDRMVKLYKKQ